MRVWSNSTFILLIDSIAAAIAQNYPPSNFASKERRRPDHDLSNRSTKTWGTTPTVNSCTSRSSSL